MIHLEIEEKFQQHVSHRLIQKAAQTALTAGRVDPAASLAILITDDQRMKQLNSRYRKVSQTTDVLAFPADFEDPDTNLPYMGDVIISFPKAKTQAESRSHSVEAELQLLTVHGVLHLLGYDHLDLDQKTEMWRLQQEVLSRLGVDLQDED